MRPAGRIRGGLGDRGAGTLGLGFPGTIVKDTATRAAGLTTLAGDGFGNGPSVPMVPHSWEHDQPGEPQVETDDS